MTYDDARREAEAMLKKLDLQSFVGVRLSDDEITLADTLRAMIAGPPEPSEEEVAAKREEIAKLVAESWTPNGVDLGVADRIQALYRSRQA